MRSLPLFHRIAGQPVVVLGEGDMAEPKRRLVERAGGEVIADLQDGIDRGARLAFIAHNDAAMCESDAIRARCAGLLVNVVDQPALCDFTTPSILERDPVLLAIGTSGASAGLAKQLRLRLEALLPADVGLLASKLETLRDRLRQVYPGGAERRRALDAALGAGGPLDPLTEGAHERVSQWLDDGAGAGKATRVAISLTSPDPEDLTLRAARLLGSADVVIHDAAVPSAVLARARADARRIVLPADAPDMAGLVVVLRFPKL
jgi:uroporphyrin-III C-methyltransferase/precorrin-2 dehydrogenase/sirohydrochlorin ferrochelatase